MNQNINKFFLSDTKKEQNHKGKVVDDQAIADSDIDLLLNEEEDIFKIGKLKKVSNIIKKKEIIREERKNKRKVAKNLFIDDEAELGSDDEEHDDEIRACDDSDVEYDRKLGEEEENNAAENVEGLIDACYENKSIRERNKDEELVYEKYFNEELKRDKELVKKIINFDYNQRKNKYLDNHSDNEEGYIPLQERFKLANSQSDNAGNLLESFKFEMFKNMKRKEENKGVISSSDNEETKELQLLRQESLIKKHAEKNSIYTDVFKQRLLENNKILSNHCINLDKIDSVEEKVKGYLENTDLSDKVKNVNLIYNCGAFYSRNNSVLSSSMNKEINLFKKKSTTSVVDMERNNSATNAATSLGNSLDPAKATSANNENSRINNGKGFGMCLSSLWMNGSSGGNYSLLTKKRLLSS